MECEVNMERLEAISKLKSIIDNKEDGYLTAQYYVHNLANSTGIDYDEVVYRMLDWINNRKFLD